MEARAVDTNNRYGYAKGAVIYQVGDPWVMPEPNRPYRGKILFASGDWQELLPKGVEKGGGQVAGEIHSHPILNAREQRITRCEESVRLSRRVEGLF
jgi:hypothetical protein